MFLSSINERIFANSSNEEVQGDNQQYSLKEVLSETLNVGYIACKFLCRTIVVNPLISLKNRTLGINKELLFEASLKGDVSTVEKCLEAGININSRNPDDETALDVAIKADQEEVVKILLESDPVVDIQDSKGNTTLHIASVSNSASSLKLLLQRNISLDAQNNTGKTALHYAVIKNNLDCFKLLLKAGANVNIQDKSGCAALHYAVLRNDLEYVNFLLKADANINIRNKDGLTALDFAIGSNNNPCIDLLLDTQDGYGRSALHYAVLRDDQEYVNLLIGLGANVNLQDAGANTALDLAITNNKSCASALVNFPNDEGYTALHLATLKGDSVYVTALVNSGADLNIQDKDGYTALHLATLNCDLNCVNLLIEAGANTNIKDNKGRTALHLASTGQSEEIIQILVKNNANVNVQDHAGRKPINYVDANSEIGKLVSDKTIDNVKRNFEQLRKTVKGFFS